MLKKHEIGAICLASLVIGFVTSFRHLQTYEWQTLFTFLKFAGLGLIAVIACVATSKFVANEFGCDAEFRLWTMDRYGFERKHYLRKTMPTWILVPLFLVFISWGYIKWLGLLVFDIGHSTRVAKGRDYTEMTEWELALIAFYGLLTNVALAIISKFLGWDAFSSLNIWFVFFNLLPISELNGTKILHGSIMLWIFSIVLVSIMIILLGITNILTTVIAAVAFALVAVIAFFHFFER